MEQNQEIEELCKKGKDQRTVHQARLLLMEIGTFLNLPIERIQSNPANWDSNRAEAIRNEGWFNETLDKIEELSKCIYYKIARLQNRETGSIDDMSTIDMEFLLWASAYIHNLVRKAETVGECTGEMIRGPKL